MTLAKRVAIVFLSVLLFLSLSLFGVAFAINRTVLNPDFLVSELDTLDVPSLAEDVLKEQIPEEVRGIIPPELIDEVLGDVVTALEPWVREQASVAIYAGYDYLLGRSENLSLVIDVEPVKEQAKDKAWQVFLEILPPQMGVLPEAEIERYFNELYAQISEQLPSTLEINESVINEISPEIMPLLTQARRYIGYFQIAYWALIAAIALLIMGIILLDRRVRGATRWIGIPCLISGIATYVFTFVIRPFAETQIAQLGLPTQLQDWLPQLFNGFLAPIQIYGIILMAVGGALLIVSFVYKRHYYEY